jgi:hypothetical protein
MSTLATKLHDLNEKIEGIRREQQYQREIESVFRDASERVNKRALWWSLLQMVVLVGAGAWQMRHLKVSFWLSQARRRMTLIVLCRFSLKIKSLDSGDGRRGCMSVSSYEIVPTNMDAFSNPLLSCRPLHMYQLVYPLVRRASPGSGGFTTIAMGVQVMTKHDLGET